MKNRIRMLRNERGLTLAELSHELKNRVQINLTPDTLAKYERSDREPKLATWKQLADFFGVSVSYLQGFTTKKLPVLPQDVTNLLNNAKKHEYSLGWIMHGAYTGLWIQTITNWLLVPSNQDIFARAWLDGYWVKS